MTTRFTRLVALAFVSVLALTCTTAAHAAATFPITEQFNNSTVGPDWLSSGSTVLTAPTDGEGNGWLRLTGAVNNQFGSIVNDNEFDSSRGVLAEFSYATHSGTGADGLVFFLYDGATPYGSFQTGPAGGSIGYTNCQTPGYVAPGLSGAYIGVAFDEWGNFGNDSFCLQNGGLPGNTLYPGRVVVR
jgi:Bacterial lectin